MLNDELVNGFTEDASENICFDMLIASVEEFFLKFYSKLDLLKYIYNTVYVISPVGLVRSTSLLRSI